MKLTIEIDINELKVLIKKAHRVNNNPKEAKSLTLPASIFADHGIEMLPIPAGEFSMGSENGYNNEKPVHQVTITKPFWISQTQVTQGQWEAVMGTDPSHFKGEDLPVENVSWHDAMAFCQKLTEREREAGCLPDGYVYTLPTEAQWEYACRAGTTGASAGDVDAMAWHIENSGKKTRPVAQKKPNAWGLYDCHGNVWEWCTDWYDTYPNGAVSDPSGPLYGYGRVFRGGCWGDAAQDCHSTVRGKRDPGSRGGSLGFRLVLVSIS